METAVSQSTARVYASALDLHLMPRLGAVPIRDIEPGDVVALQLVELSALIERLARVVDPSYIPVWLRKPVPALEDDKPLDVIGRGDYRRVAALVSAVEESPTT